MIKKVLFVGAGVALVGALMFGRNACYMAGDFFSSVRDAGESMVPIDQKIKHARRDVKALDGELKNLMHDIAKEELQCEKLRSEVQDKSKGLNELQVHMEILNNHLKKNASLSYVATNGKSYTPQQVKEDLKTSLKSYKSQNLTLAALEKQLESRMTVLQSARDQMDETQRVKLELMAELEALEAQHKMNEVAKVTSEFKLDDSKVARAKEAVEKIRTEINVESNLVNQFESPTQIPTQEVESSDDDWDSVTAQIDALSTSREESLVDNQ